MGSTALQRSGHRVIAYDARGHGTSSPATDPGAYGYEQLGLDLEAVLDASGIERAVLAGASMGAHTLLWLALNRPERVAGAGRHNARATTGNERDDPARLAHWDALSDGLRDGGIDGFLAAYGSRGYPSAGARRCQGDPPAARPARASRGGRRRAAAVPRSRPFGGDRRSGGDRRADDRGRLRRRGRSRAPAGGGRGLRGRDPGARLVTDEPGRSPIAWQGSQLSRVIAEVADAGPDVSAEPAGYSGTPLRASSGSSRRPGSRW